LTFQNHISQTVHDLAKNPTEMEPRDPERDKEILRLNITPSNEFAKNAEIIK